MSKQRNAIALASALTSAITPAAARAHTSPNRRRTRRRAIVPALAIALAATATAALAGCASPAAHSAGNATTRTGVPASSTQSANRAAATVTIPTPAVDPSLAADPAVAKLNGTITFGTEGTYSPFDYHPAGGGALTGYDVDVAKAVAAKLGLTAKFQETTWDALFPALTSHRIDAALDEIEITPQRQATYDLTDPYSVSYPVVITKASDTSITQASDLKGKSSANSSGSNWGAIAEKYGATVNPVSQFTDAVAAVKAGRVDLTVNDQLAALDYFNTTHDTKVKIALKLTGDKVSQGIAFRKGSGLLPAVNKAIAELRQDGTLALIGQKYFGQDVSK